MKIALCPDCGAPLDYRPVREGWVCSSGLCDFGGPGDAAHPPPGAAVVEVQPAVAQAARRETQQQPAVCRETHPHHARQCERGAHELGSEHWFGIGFDGKPLRRWGGRNRCPLLHGLWGEEPRRTCALAPGHDGQCSESEP